jgi:hypothetical protein
MPRHFFLFLLFPHQRAFPTSTGHSLFLFHAPLLVFFFSVPVCLSVLPQLMLYSALTGVDPKYCLPITLDRVGTNNASHLSDPMYIGLRQPRDRSPAYDALIDEFMTAAQERWGAPCCCSSRTSETQTRPGCWQSIGTDAAHSTTTSREPMVSYPFAALQPAHFSFFFPFPRV